MTFNLTSVQTSSNGIWQGDNPLDYAFPLLIIQITLVLVVGRSLAFLLKPLRQPNVIAEIVGGILLGPSALGRNKTYLHKIFPSWSTPILESVASIGLLFFLFLVGLELDLNSIRRSGRKAFTIAAAGISLPFTCGVGVAFVLRSNVEGAKQAGYAQFLVFMGVSLSITAFPVLARILAELKLLTTRVGETAMAAAAFNDLAAWVLLALAVALAGNGNGGGHKSPILCVWVLLSGVAFVVFMLAVIRPVMTWIGRRCSQEDVNEGYIALTLAGVLVSGFVTDFIGIHSIFGAFVFGLTIPKEGDFARKLIERIEDFVSGLLLPLYFASSGLKTDVTKIHGAEAWGLLVLVITTACVGKILGTFVAAMVSKIPARESLTLGVLMNTKGLVELIVLNIGKEKKVLNDEIFAILVLMALFTTFITTPTVMMLYKPARRTALPAQRKLQRESPSKAKAKVRDKLRILACVHCPGNVPSLINLIESIRGNKKSPLKLYIMHLVELTERSSSIIMAQRARRNGLPFIDRLRRGDSHDGVTLAFEAYGQLGRVTVRTMTAISALHTMHDDVCQVAEEKRVSMIILPFHKQGRGDGSGSGPGELENVGHSWRVVNQRILKESPCSVAVSVNRHLGSFSGSKRISPSTSATMAKRVCVVFFGGPDDREALELGGRMAEHPEIKVTVVRFVADQGAAPTGIMLRPSPEKSSESNYSFSTAVMDREREKELDEVAVAEFRRRWEGMADYTERVAKENVVEGVVAIGRSGEYEMVVVGKGRFPSTMVAELADRSAVHPELGPIGDVLASPSHGVVCSVVVIQQHDLMHGNEVPASKIVDGADAFHTATITPIGTRITTDKVSV